MGYILDCKASIGKGFRLDNLWAPHLGPWQVPRSSDSVSSVRLDDGRVTAFPFMQRVVELLERDQGKH